VAAPPVVTLAGWLALRSTFSVGYPYLPARRWSEPTADELTLASLDNNEAEDNAGEYFRVCFRPVGDRVTKEDGFHRSESVMRGWHSVCFDLKFERADICSVAERGYLSEFPALSARCSALRFMAVVFTLNNTNNPL